MSLSPATCSRHHAQSPTGAMCMPCPQKQPMQRLYGTTCTPCGPHSRLGVCDSWALQQGRPPPSTTTQQAGHISRPAPQQRSGTLACVTSPRHLLVRGATPALLVLLQEARIVKSGRPGLPLRPAGGGCGCRKQCRAARGCAQGRWAPGCCCQVKPAVKQPRACAGAVAGCGVLLLRQAGVGGLVLGWVVQAAGVTWEGHTPWDTPTQHTCLGGASDISSCARTTSTTSTLDVQAAAATAMTYQRWTWCTQACTAGRIATSKWHLSRRICVCCHGRGCRQAPPGCWVLLARRPRNLLGPLQLACSCSCGPIPAKDGALGEFSRVPGAGVLQEGAVVASGCGTQGSTTTIGATPTSAVI
jgi:hypothetical protein